MTLFNTDILKKKKKSGFNALGGYEYEKKPIFDDPLALKKLKTVAPVTSPLAKGAVAAPAKPPTAPPAGSPVDLTALQAQMAQAKASGNTALMAELQKKIAAGEATQAGAAGGVPGGVVSVAQKIAPPPAGTETTPPPEGTPPEPTAPFAGQPQANPPWKGDTPKQYWELTPDDVKDWASGTTLTDFNSAYDAMRAAQSAWQQARDSGAPRDKQDALSSAYSDAQKKYYTAAQTVMSDWDRKGSQERSLNDLINNYDPNKYLDQLSPFITDPVQKNAFVRDALDALKNNVPIADVIKKYQQFFPANYDFSLGDPKFKAELDKLGLYTDVESPDIKHGEDIKVEGGELEKTDTTKITSAADQEITTLIEQYKKDLQSQGYDDATVDKLLAGTINQLDRDQQDAIRSAMGQLGAAGFAQTAGAVSGAIGRTAAEFSDKRLQARADIIKQGLAESLQKRQTALQGLENIATLKTGREATAAEIASGESKTKAELEERRGEAEAQMKLAQDTLFQEGELTAAGQQIDQALKKYGIQLSDVMSQREWNAKMVENDLKERIAASGATQAEAELQAKNIVSQIEAGIRETELDDARDTARAELELKAAAGDRDARIQVDQLNLEKAVRQQGFSNDMTMWVGGLYWSIISSREQLDQELKIEIMRMDAAIKAEQAKQGKSGGLLGLLGDVAGAIPGIGSVISTIKPLFGGGESGKEPD